MSSLFNFLKAKFNNFFSGVFSCFAVVILSLVFSRLDLSYRGEFDLSYSELSAILLTAAGVIITVFGVGLAVMALIGWDKLRESAKQAAIEAAAEAAETAAKRVASQAAMDHVAQELEKDGLVWRMMEEHVDDLLAGATRRRDKGFPNQDSEYGD